MELKDYQRETIETLKTYLNLLSMYGDPEVAFDKLWLEKNIDAHLIDYTYHDTLEGIADVCIKVPTGGGKTFIACNALKPLVDTLEPTYKVVVWLVPSRAILTQTLLALKNPNHPYRQKINTLFQGKVEVYTKEELLTGQNFSQTVLTEQLSILVLSYDSFRGHKDLLKAKRQNPALASLAKNFEPAMHRIKEAHETSLMQVINNLNPIVIVDESHHVGSPLSREMLENFNPRFVLNLTATPRANSNVISSVTAWRLKQAQMVKLPLIVYNRDNSEEVLIDAIDLRNRLEEIASSEKGRYIRPIVLFQAQPQGKEDAKTFEKLKDSLIKLGVPEEQIAIRTANIDELRNVDLMKKDCPIRHIITVNALKEGWDCPFAYILATVANRSSKVEVEQIIGRVLRQPYAHILPKTPLNLSYVLTSSADFSNTLQEIRSGLVAAGFSSQECKVAETSGTDSEEVESPESDTVTTAPLATGTSELSESASKEKVYANGEGDKPKEDHPDTGHIDDMLDKAEEADKDFVEENEGKAQNQDDLPEGVKEGMEFFEIVESERDNVASLRLPQFFTNTGKNIVLDDYKALVDKTHLVEDFHLSSQELPRKFSLSDPRIMQIDVKRPDGTFKIGSLDQKLQSEVKKYLANLDEAERLDTYRGMVFKRLSNINFIDQKDIKNYVERIFKEMDDKEMEDVAKSPLEFASHIRDHINKLVDKYCESNFYEKVETGEILVAPNWKFESRIFLNNPVESYDKTLYEAEEDGNNLEKNMMFMLASAKNVQWWHRNIPKSGFCINGFINHYPDFIVQTKSGRILLIETKGKHLLNDDSNKKLKLGRKWQEKAGNDYRYFMVFDNSITNEQSPSNSGIYSMDNFKNILLKL